MADVSLFFQNFDKKIVMTSGADGAYFFHKDEVSHQPVDKVTNVVDTTGAGDNFAAGFLDFYLQGKSAKESLENGNAKAVQVIQQLGPRIQRVWKNYINIIICFIIKIIRGKKSGLQSKRYISKHIW